MKKFFVVAALGFGLIAGATPVWSQTITSANPTVAVSTRISTGQYIVVNCNLAAYGNFGTTSSATVTTSAYALLFEAGKNYRIFMHPGHPFLAILSVAGTAVCQVSNDN